jgi:glycosyltransferase involved in cell wall biosynthesis
LWSPLPGLAKTLDQDVMIPADLAPVSVVMPCFNCGLTLQRAFSSILRQSSRPAEVILIDDASSDNTWTELREIENSYPGWVKLVPLVQNRGAASARNAGWAVTTQPYIAFLDADDAWHPEKIRIQWAYMKEHPDVALCGHGHRTLSGGDTQPDWALVHGRTEQIHKWSLLMENRFITPSVMLRSDIGERFSEGRRHMEDRLLWLKVVLGGYKAVRLGADLAATYKKPFGTAGLSSNMWQMTLADVDNYRLLHAAGSLSVGATCCLMIFSILKFVRRLCILMFWRGWGNK